MTGLVRRAPLLLMLAALAACAPVRVRQTPAAAAAQQAREAQLSPRTNWRISAHIFISDGADNNGSGELDWRHAGERYDFTLRAPTGRTWKLHGDAGGAVLEGVDGGPVRGSNAEQLLRERTGWDVPVTDLSAWVRGLGASGSPADIRYDAQNLPAALDQDGWKLEYRDWFANLDPPMPRRVFAERGAARVKIAIERWTFDE